MYDFGEMDDRVREILSAGVKRGRPVIETASALGTAARSRRALMRHSWHCTCAHLPEPPETFPPLRLTGPAGHSWESILLASKIRR